MKWLAAQTKWIMLISGILTCTIFIYVVAPNYAATSGFGQPLADPLSNLMARSWGMMVGLFGIMLIYAAFRPPLQRFALTFVALGKAGFVLLLLTVGKVFLNQQMGFAVYADGLEVVLYVCCLLGMRSRAMAGASAHAEV
jgi:hypothetical protein